MVEGAGRSSTSDHEVRIDSRQADHQTLPGPGFLSCARGVARMIWTKGSGRVRSNPPQIGPTDTWSDARSASRLVECKAFVSDFARTLSERQNMLRFESRTISRAGRPAT